MVKATGPFSFLTHQRNDWAWMGIFFCLLAGLGFFLHPGLMFILALLAALFGTMGTMTSYRWDMDGNGRWLSNTAIVISLGLIAYFLKLTNYLTRPPW